MRWIVGLAAGAIACMGAVVVGAQEAPAPAAAPDARAVEFFETRIRPLLAEQCYSCHGKQNRKGGLRLDSAAALLKGGDTGPAVVPGSAEKSLLIHAVSYTRDHLKMPPQGRLKPQQIADLTAWVKLGAPWPSERLKDEGGAMKGRKSPAHPSSLILHPSAKHWAFQAVRRAAPPAVRNRTWVRNPVDAFVLARLEATGLKPAPRADKRTLIRRVTFDLTGLPPTPDEVQAFLADSAPDAFARVVDRLLASPAYGERWARHWLDVARYADSNGLDENTAFANAWRYRDYVVRAFNNDKPYDEFVREQIAGDLLPASQDDAVNSERLTATGFLVLGPKVLAEPDKQKMVMDIVDEQIDTMGRAFMGLTLGCARCHDHKFDPIPTKDYYALAGIFKSTKTMASLATVARAYERPLAGREAVAAREAHERLVQAKQVALREATERTNARISAAVINDLDRYLLTAAAPAGTPLPAGLEAETARQAQAYLAAARARGGDRIFEPWILLADLPESSFAADGARLVTDWKATGRMLTWLPPVAALFDGDAPASREEAAARYKKLFLRVNQAWSNLVQKARKPPARLNDSDLETLRQVLYVPNGAFGLNRIERWYTAADKAALASLTSEAEELKKAAPAAVPAALAVEEAKEIGNVRIHVRGSHLALGEEAPRRFPTILAGSKQPEIPRDRSGRLELANWLARSDHPLTARVMVNRIWQHHFGEGIVRSPDNFGRLGDKPTHPELLDYLASQFTGSGWSVKSLHRLILLSNSYQMSTAYNAKAALADPENRLLWRFNRRRLEIEAIRDSMLSISGDLDRAMGGSLLGTKNFEYVTNDQSANAARYDTPRRSVYLPVIRNAVFDVFQVFDFVEPSFLNGKRASTTVAPQALFLLNGQFVMAQSRAFSERVLAEAGADEDARVRRAYIHAYGRPASAVEVSAARAYVQRYEAGLASETDASKRRAIAWQSFCQILFASNEFVYVN